MTKATQTLLLTTVGPLHLAGPDGEELTPKGTKAQALIALLALSPGMSRPRRWVEDKLWSTFGPEQAGANLRQALMKMRSSLKGYADVLITDRNTVALDTNLISVDLLDGELPVDTPYELLEGMDVRDPEFEEWLRLERAQLEARLAAARPTKATGLLVQCRSEVIGGDMNTMVADILANQVGENIAEYVRAWRQAPPPEELVDETKGDLDIACNILGTEGGHSLFIKATHVPTGRILYSKLHPLARLEDIVTSEQSIAAIVFEAADRVVGKLPQILDSSVPEARATALSRLAMYRMFSFEADALREADGLLKQAHDVDGNGIYLAWRSLIRTIQYIELMGSDQKSLIDEAAELNVLAMEQASDNPLVQALISQVRVATLGDAAGAVDLAEQAVERNPASGFAWQSMSSAEMLKGDPKKAFEHSARARAIARFSPFRQWWDLCHCIVSIACDNPGEAIEAGEAAARSAPSFRPAHRHLLALYAMGGEYEKANATAQKLRQIEPGFSLEKMLEDENYPVRTLRRNGMLEPLRNLL